jgi:hypothetical protein
MKLLVWQVVAKQVMNWGGKIARAQRLPDTATGEVGHYFLQSGLGSLGRHGAALDGFDRGDGTRLW